MERDDVGALQQLVQLHILGDLCSALAAAAVIGQHLHAQGGGDAAHGLADAAEAYDAHSLAGELDHGVIPEAPVSAGRPFPLMYRLVMVAGVAAYLQQQGDGKLGHGVGAVGRHVGYGYALLPGVDIVDGVVARGLYGDKADVGAGVYHPAGDLGLVGDDYFRIAYASDDLFLVPGIVVEDPELSELLILLPAQVPGVHGITVNNSQFHFLYLIKNFFSS